MLVRGVDEFGYWGRDREPKRDLDPDCMEAIEYWIKEYANPTIVQEAKMAGCTETSLKTDFAAPSFVFLIASNFDSRQSHM